MPQRKSITRRGFLKGAAAIGAACAAPTIVPASVFGQEGKCVPSDRITVGMIGVGRQTKIYNIPQFLALPDVQIVAVCDVDSWRLDQAKQQVEKAYAKGENSGKYDGCDTYGDFNDVLVRDDIDAVMISTPDHWHVPIALAALAAGKDVSLEKPIVRSVGDGRRLVEAVAKYNRIFRVDSEFRSISHVHHAAELVRNGRLGKIHTVTVSVPKDDLICDWPPDMPVPPELDYERWQGPAPRTPYTEMRVHKPKSFDRAGWMRHIYYTDGMITNWTAHLNDGAAWCTGLDTTGPIEIEGTGTYPPPENFWNPLWTFNVNMLFADGVRWNYFNDTSKVGPVLKIDAPYFKVEGSDGWIKAGFTKIEAEPASLLESKIAQDEIHLPLKTDKRDFIDGVKSRQQPLETAEIGQRVTSLGLLGQIAIQIGEKLRWDPEKEQFIGNDAANAMLDKPIIEPRRII